MQQREIRLVLTGDPGAGKSTLISSLIKECFMEDVQAVVPEITLPPDVSPEGVTTKIVDTCGTEERERLETELRRANVIALVYSVVDADSFERISGYWLPYIRSLGINVPVVLVGNKIDLRETDASDEALEEEIAPVMADFKEVETCIECSARLSLNVSEAFFFAQKAVLYPTAPLYDSRSHTLKPACVDALRNIFRLCDADKDDVLSDVELNEFQYLCFDAPLQLQELEGIKELVFEHTDEHGEGPHLRDGQLTLAGFLYLHTLFIQRGRLETTWTVLWTFGYGMDLTLTSAYIYPPFEVPRGCAVELSPSGYQFLTEVFKMHDKNHDGALNEQELENLFSTAPGGRHPWDSYNFPASTITDEHGAVTLQGWLAQWSMTTLFEPRTTLAYLAYLGYPLYARTLRIGTTSPRSGSSGSGRVSPAHSSTTPTAYAWHDGPGASVPRLSMYDETTAPMTTALKLVRQRRTHERKRQGADQANVFLALVLGAPGSGKTALLRNMLGKPFQHKYGPTHRLRRAVAAIEQGGAERYLVLQEFGSRNEAEALRNTPKLAAVSVVVYVYDSSDTHSFSYIANLRQHFHALAALPSLFVATKSDLDLAQQRHEVQPDMYCRKLGLHIQGLGSGPLSVSVKYGQVAELYSLVLSIATDARGSIPAGGGKLTYARMPWRLTTYTALALLGVLSVSWTAWRWFHPRMMPGSGTMRGLFSPSWLPWRWGAGATPRIDL